MNTSYSPNSLPHFLVFCLLLISIGQSTQAQIINVGSGSYTNTFPGVDAANRNEYPSGTPLTIGTAATKPVPTNDWWSDKIKNNHSSNLFNYPFTLKTLNAGIVPTYIPWGVIGDNEPIIVGVEGLNATRANISDFTDWTITMDWSNGDHNFTTTTGIGMPFLYFTKDDNDVARVQVKKGNATVTDEMIVITDVSSGADFAIYAPDGSTWTQSGNVYTSDLNGKNYWSLAFLPLDASNPASKAIEYQEYAYVFPTDTKVSWAYDESTSKVTTDFEITTDVKEGTFTNVLQGLLPHQWDNLTSSSPSPAGDSYNTVRGEVKMLAGNSFTVENTFYGILPTLPFLDYYSDGFDPAALAEKVEQLENDGLATWTDSYNQGQEMNRLIQIARIADLMGEKGALDKLLATIEERLEDWLKYESGEVAFLFYYHDTWDALIGYPAGHGQDNNINDHHFHWGYFIHAAAFLEQYKPGWADDWGDMVNYLVRDAATDDRDDDLFPFLRNFSPYAGHSWANGFATFPQGNDQESTSESMQFCSSLIHWGTVTGNKQIRDLGIYLYTTEQSAVEEYWFDIHERVFPTNQYSVVSRVWGNSYDNGTFWTADIAASYGIEMYPIHGGSLYLGHHHEYAEDLWTEIGQNTGILSNEVNPNLWHDVKWKYLAFTDAEKAIELYDDYTERALKFGISDGLTYHWLHAMNALGRVDATITADYPIAAAFDDNGDMTYVAHNYGEAEIDVTFSDGYVLTVPAQSMATSRDLDIEGTLSTSFDRAYQGGSVDLSLTIDKGTPTRVVFMNGSEQVGEDATAPFGIKATDLDLGKHAFYARLYDGDNFTITNLVRVTVGEQVSYLGDPVAIPGSFETGQYDVFEGGAGQGIAYSDADVWNSGDFRTDEYVDAGSSNTEGKTIGWLAAGEWIEYTVDVQQAGYYTMAFRYASDNAAGGGPFSISSDGMELMSNITVNSTSGWDTWQTKTVTDVPLKKGEQVIRLTIGSGEFNLAKFTFTFDRALDYSQPIADAGENFLVQLPTTSAMLDGSGSSDPDGGALTYTWEQVYGPSVLTFTDANTASPNVSGLEEGVYLLNLHVSNGTYSDDDQVYVVSSTNDFFEPSISITSPTADAEYAFGSEINITAAAKVLVGEITDVKFYMGSTLISTDTEAPFEAAWTPAASGNYVLTAEATTAEAHSKTSNAVSVTIEGLPTIPGKIEAEDYTNMSGVETEETTDAGGGINVGWIDANDWLEYKVEVTTTGEYEVSYRVAAEGQAGRMTLSANGADQATTDLPVTGGWQSWQTVTETINLTKGLNTIRLTANTGGFNLNWMDFVLTVTALDDDGELPVSYYPNPVNDHLTLLFPQGEKQVSIFDNTGRLVESFEVNGTSYIHDMSRYANGLYLFQVRTQNAATQFKIVK